MKRDVCADMEADENIAFTGEMLSRFVKSIFLLSEYTNNTHVSIL